MNRISELRRILFALAALMLPAVVCALPEDDRQQIIFEEFASTDYSLDEGVIIQKAHPDRPTCIRQGTRVICGAEIRFERAENGTLKKVTATGTPARFEQKPAADQDVVHFSGLKLVFDNDARLLTIDGEATFSRGKDVMTHRHMEYNLDTGEFTANGGDSDESGSFIISPDTANGE